MKLKHLPLSRTFSLALVCLVFFATPVLAQEATPNAQRVTDLIELAELNFSNNAFSDAILNATEAISLDANAARAFYLRGRAYHAEGEYQSAINDLTQAITLVPTDVDAYLWRGVSHQYVGLLEEALNDLTFVIEADPRNIQAYYWRSWVHYAQAEYDRAAMDATRALEIDETFIDGYYVRGMHYSRLGMYQKAIADETRAIELTTGWVSPYFYYQRALAYVGLGGDEDLALAEADLNTILEIWPSEAWIHLALGDVAQSLGDHQQALAYYSQAIQFDAASADAYLARANARYTQLDQSIGFEHLDIPQSDAQAMIDDYNRTIQFNPESATAYYRRGLVYFSLGAYQQAADDISTACDLYPSEDCAIDLGEIFLQLNQMDQVEATYDYRLGGGGFYKDSSTTEIYRRRAILYMSRGELALAYNDLVAAIEREPHWYPTYATLADYYSRMALDVDTLIAYQYYLELAGEQAQPGIRQTAELLASTIAVRFPLYPVAGCRAVVLSVAHPDVAEVPPPDITPLLNLTTGDTVAVVGQWSRWYQVERVDGSTGWIFKPYVLLEPQNAACTTFSES